MNQVHDPENPYFSVVVPVYNRKELLLPALESVMGQDHSSFEVILIDDGSTDGTGDTIRMVYEKEERLRYVWQENAERGAARNHGWQLARGRYVVFFDSDDRMEPDYLRALESAAHQSGEAGLLATHFCFLDLQGRKRASDVQRLPEGYYDYRLFLHGNPLACNVAVRKDLHGFIPFENDRRYAVKEDWMFLISNTRHHQLYLLARTCLCMLDHPGRSMLADHGKFIEKTRLATAWIIEHVELNDQEKRVLQAHSEYIIAIHRYLEGSRKPAFKALFAAIRHSGLQLKYATLFLKILAGRRLLLRLRERK